MSRSPPPPTDAAVKAALHTILTENANDPSITKRVIRQMLEREFACDLTSRKEWINGQIKQFMSVWNVMEQEKEERASASAPTSAAKPATTDEGQRARLILVIVAQPATLRAAAGK